MPARQRSHQLACTVAEKTVITDTRKQQFIIEKEFARGGFGRIYTGRQENSKEYGKAGSLAIKIEPYANGPLFTEITVFQRILTPQKLASWMNKKNIAHVGLPPYISSGLFSYNNQKLRFLIMPCYERSLEAYRTASNDGTFDINIVSTIAKQCVDCLCYMQDHDYVHGDIKAENILLASAKKFSRCFLVDFGLARMAKGNVDKPDKKRAHNGTLLFTSLDAHRGCAPSFRGDLEILCYNILYWLCGTLPWQKCILKPEAVMAEKQKFSKELDKNIHKLVEGDVSWLTKLFKLSYETPYVGKVNFEAVHSILNEIKDSSQSKKQKSKNSVKKESAKQLPIKDEVVSKNVASSPSLKRKLKTANVGTVNDKQNSSKGRKKPFNTVAGPSTRFRASQVIIPIFSPASNSSPRDSGNNESLHMLPEPKRRKSDRISSQSLNSSMQSSDEKLLGNCILGTGTDKIKNFEKEELSTISRRKGLRGLRPRPQVSLKSSSRKKK